VSARDQLRLARGSAEQVRHRATWLTGYECALRVGGAPVQVVAPDVVRVDEGDRVAVAGYDRDGVLAAVAYANATTGAAWDLGGRLVASGVVLATLGLAQLALALFMLVWADDVLRETFFVVLSGVFLLLAGVSGAVGARLIRRGRRVRAARRTMAIDDAADAGRCST
jgi:hypothetical protein